MGHLTEGLQDSYMGWVTLEGSAAAVAVYHCHAHSQKLEDPGSVHVENLGVVVVLKQQKSDMAKDYK